MTIREPDVALPPSGGCPYCQNQGVLVVSEIVDAQNTLRDISTELHIEIACPWCHPVREAAAGGGGMTADLLAALQMLLDDMDHEANSHFIGLPWYGQDRYEAPAAVAAHKSAHRAGADDACRCYAEGWVAARRAL